MHEDENDLVRQPAGRFAFEADEDFRVVFRRADGTLAEILTWGGAGAVVLGTVVALVAEKATSPIAWMIAGLFDFAAVYVFFALRRGLSRGGISVDGAEKRVLLPQGAELAFDRLRGVTVRPAGERAELYLLHVGGAIRFGERPAAEVETAAAAVARVAEIPRIPWAEAGAPAAA